MIIFLLIVSLLTGWPIRPYLIWLWYLSPSSSTWFLSFTSSKSHWLLAYLWPLRHTTPAWNSQPQKHTESKLTLSALISPLQRPGYPDHLTYHTLSLSPNFLSSFLPTTYHNHNLEYVYLPLSISLVGGKLQEGRDFVPLLISWEHCTLNKYWLNKWTSYPHFIHIRKLRLSKVRWLGRGHSTSQKWTSCVWILWSSATGSQVQPCFWFREL